MPSYIGTIANLMPVSWTISESVKPTSRYTFQDAPGRRWAFATKRPDGTSLREWDITFSGTNTDHAVINGFAHGLYGDGPFVFIAEGATLTNVLTPSQSRFSSVGGTNTVVASKVPIVPGKPVIISMETSGVATLKATLQDSTGGTVATKTAKANGVLTQTVAINIPSVPAGARQVSIEVSGHTFASKPQVVWSDKQAPWDFGQGASQVVISDSSSDWEQYETSTGESWRGMPVKITEVG